MAHLLHKYHSSALFLGIGILMLFSFCAPAYASDAPANPTFRSTSPFGINQTIQGATVNINGIHQGTIYKPFSSDHPYADLNPGNGSGGSNNDDDDDIGIPGWADTPSEPLPIGDGIGILLLMATMMVGAIFLKQRKQLSESISKSTTSTTNINNLRGNQLPTALKKENNTTQHMTTRKQTYQSFFQKLFLLLAFVCFVGQVSGQTYYKRELFNRSQTKSNRPTNFPDKTAKYTGAFQGAHVNGAFYTYDRWTPGLVKITDAGVVSLPKSYPNWVESKTGYSTRTGTCCDDAGNLIINPYYGKLVIFSGGDLNSSKELTYTLGTNASCNYISASGNVMSSTGGYLYFYPNEKSTIYVVKIVSGAINGTYSTVGTTKCKGYSSSYVIPLDNTSKNFIYHSRHGSDTNAKKYYHYNNGTHTELCTSNTLGGTAFKLGGVQMFIQTANDTYKGGWRMSTLSAPATYLLEQDKLGTSGYDTNEACASFFTYERVNDYNVKLYEYCMGHGIAAWKIGTSVSKKFRIQTYDGDSWEQNANGGTVSISYNDGSTGSVTGTSNVTLSLDEGCTANLTATKKSGYEFVGWYINGTSGIGSQYSTTTTYIPTRSNYEYVTARFAQMKNQTVNIHTYDATQNKYVANVAGGSVSVRYNNLGRGETTATLSSTSGTYTSLINSTVTLTATPESGYVFVGWYKGNEHMDWATTNECSFKADNAYNITARFTKLVTQTFKVQTYESTAYTDGGNGGTMTVSYNDGTTANVTNSTSISNLYQGYNVTLTANSQTGYKFMGWFNNDFTTEYSKGSNTIHTVEKVHAPYMQDLERHITKRSR